MSVVPEGCWDCGVVGSLGNEISDLDDRIDEISKMAGIGAQPLDIGSRPGRLDDPVLWKWGGTDPVDTTDVERLCDGRSMCSADASLFMLVWEGRSLETPASRFSAPGGVWAYSDGLVFIGIAGSSSSKSSSIASVRPDLVRLRFLEGGACGRCSGM